MNSRKEVLMLPIQQWQEEMKKSQDKLNQNIEAEQKSLKEVLKKDKKSRRK